MDFNHLTSESAADALNQTGSKSFKDCDTHETACGTCYLEGNGSLTMLEEERAERKRPVKPNLAKTSCCVPNCKSTSTKNPELSFHRLPLNDAKLLRKWITNIRRKNIRLTTSTRVCSKHFESWEIRVTASGKNFLGYAVVPSVFEWNKEERYEKIKKQRNSKELKPPAKEDPSLSHSTEPTGCRLHKCLPHSTEQHRMDEQKSALLDHRYYGNLKKKIAIPLDVTGATEVPPSTTVADRMP